MSKITSMERAREKDLAKEAKAGDTLLPLNVVAFEDRAAFNELIRLQQATAVFEDVLPRHRQAAETLRLRLLPKYGIQPERGDSITNDWKVVRNLPKPNDNGNGA